MRDASPPPGLRVAAVGPQWAAYSPLTGETLLINDECAAVLEVLSEQPADLASVCHALAQDLGSDARELEKTIGPAWTQLIEAGLIEEAAAPAR